MKRLLGMASVALLSVSALATEVTRFDFDSNIVGSPARNLSYSQTPDIGVLIEPGDGFQPFSRLIQPELIPFSLLDDTCSVFPTDSQGIVDENKLDFWFGVCDLTNAENPAGTGTVTLTFDVSGFDNLSVSIDMAAMGDFEAGGTNPDFYNFTYQLDSGTETPLFTTAVNEDIAEDYTLACNPTPFTLQDPMFANGVELSNIFQTMTASISGTGNVLTIRFHASGDGGTEAFAWDNLVINSGATGGCPNPMPACTNADIFPVAGDCAVDLSDLGVVLSNYAPGVGGKTRAQGDIFPSGGTGDGFVDLSDLGLMLSSFGANCN